MQLITVMKNTKMMQLVFLLKRKISYNKSQIKLRNVPQKSKITRFVFTYLLLFS